MSAGFIFRFESEEMRRQFKVLAFNQNKSMNKLLGEIVARYLSEVKKEVA